MKTEEQAVLVVGGDSTIGSALVRELERSGTGVVQTTRRPGAVLNEKRLFLDLAAPDQIWNLPDKVATAFLLAGQTSAEQCRLHPSQTHSINVESIVSLAKRLNHDGARVVFLSSHVVFDGTKARKRANDPTCPVTEYGRQKAEAEKCLLSMGKNVVVVRLTEVIGGKNRLLNQWQESLQANRTIYPFSDMILAPISLSFVTQVLMRLITDTAGGIIHVSNAEDISYETLARQLADQIGASHDLIEPVKCNDKTAPPNTTLDTTSLQEKLGMTVPSQWSLLDSGKEEPVLNALPADIY